MNNLGSQLIYRNTTDGDLSRVHVAKTAMAVGESSVSFPGD